MALIRLIKNLLLSVIVLAAVASLSARGDQAATPTAAVESDQPGLDLEAALRTAYLHNWDLLAARSNVDAAIAQHVVAREFPNPTLSFSTTKINADNHPAQTIEGNGIWSRNYDTTIAVSQFFEIGGKRPARQQSALAGVRGARARLADARRLLNQAVTQAYVAVLLAERNQQVLADSARSLREEAKIAETRERAGDISSADRNQIEIGAARLELDAEAARTATRAARIQLEVLLGNPEPHGQTHLIETLEQISVQGTPDAHAEMGARNSRPDLAAAEAARAKAQADVRLQRAMRVPDPTVSLQYEHQPADAPNTVGFLLSFPLPLWNQNKGNIDAARAAEREAAVQAEKIRSQIVADIDAARSAFEGAEARWRRYRDELQPKSRQVRETVAFAYQRGGASLLDLLTAQRTDNEVRLATAQAAADSANAAAALSAALNTGSRSSF